MFGYQGDQDEPRRGREAPTPAPIMPLFLGVVGSFVVFLLWGMVGMPVVGIVGGIFVGIVIVTLLLWRSRPVPVDDDEEEPVRWGE